jgi:hypothetical protein
MSISSSPLSADSFASFLAVAPAFVFPFPFAFVVGFPLAAVVVAFFDAAVAVVDTETDPALVRLGGTTGGSTSMTSSDCSEGSMTDSVGTVVAAL